MNTMEKSLENSMKSANEIFYNYKMQHIAEEKCPRLKKTSAPFTSHGFMSVGWPSTNG
jgi:hypothetical protein